jgi:hypothetical protein
MITSHFVRWYVALVGILLCATLYVAMPAKADCIGHDCGGPYLTMPQSHPLNLTQQHSTGYQPARLPLTIKPLK